MTQWAVTITWHNMCECKNRTLIHEAEGLRGNRSGDVTQRMESSANLASSGYFASTQQGRCSQFTVYPGQHSFHIKAWFPLE